MNDFEKSLERIRSRVEPGDSWTEEDWEHYKIIIKALKKQVPEKVLPEKKFYGNGICPSCDVYFVDKTTDFCGNCGQALDWEVSYD